MGQTVITQITRDNKNPQIKNLHGKLGEICSYCAGLGFTNTVGGGSAGCHRCDQTGIEPINVRELAQKVDKLTGMVLELINK